VRGERRSTLERKIAAMQLHRSQDDDPARLAGFLREVAATAGQGQGLAHAEAYRAIGLNR
jgi:hypothetical protein